MSGIFSVTGSKKLFGQKKQHVLLVERSLLYSHGKKNKINFIVASLMEHGCCSVGMVLFFHEKFF